MVITLPTIGAHCSDHNKEEKKKLKKMDGGMRRRGIKGKRRRRGVTIGWGFQVMLIPLIYLISGWQWALFTSDVPLLGETDERGKNRGRADRYQKIESEQERQRGFRA